jgi:hypothetical protein
MDWEYRDKPVQTATVFCSPCLALLFCPGWWLLLQLAEQLARLELCPQFDLLDGYGRVALAILFETY